MRGRAIDAEPTWCGAETVTRKRSAERPCSHEEQRESRRSRFSKDAAQATLRASEEPERASPTATKSRATSRRALRRAGREVIARQDVAQRASSEAGAITLPLSPRSAGDC